MQESVYRNVTNQKQLSAQDLENVMMNKINELNKQQSNDVPYHFKSGEMCKRIVLEENLLSIFVPDCYVTQEIHEKAVFYYPGALACVLDHYKIQEMCERDVAKEFRMLEYVYD